MQRGYGSNSWIELPILAHFWKCYHIQRTNKEFTANLVIYAYSISLSAILLILLLHMTECVPIFVLERVLPIFVLERVLPILVLERRSFCCL